MIFVSNETRSDRIMAPCSVSKILILDDFRSFEFAFETLKKCPADLSFNLGLKSGKGIPLFQGFLITT